MISVTETMFKPCLQCGKCCENHPCALAPEDLSRIANFLGLTEEELFKRFLVLDYVEDTGQKHYYVSLARKSSRPGRIVRTDWAFADSPCIFLRDGRCTIERVKPKGGRVFYCRLLTNSNRNIVGYGKKRAAVDWSKSDLLKHLIVLAERQP